MCELILLSPIRSQVNVLKLLPFLEITSMNQNISNATGTLEYSLDQPVLTLLLFSDPVEMTNVNKRKRVSLSSICL